MPSTLHEAFVEFVRQRPAFVAEVLAGPLNVRLPEFRQTRLDSGDFTNVAYPGCVVTPLVLGPDRVPVVTDPAVAGRSPELTVLSALAHGARPGRREIFPALLAALATFDDDHEQLYYDLVFAGLPEPARHDLEDLMTATTYEFRSEFLRNLVHKNRDEGRAEGRAEGEATAVLTVLATREIDVPDDAKARITGCTDLDQLENWIRRAATATIVNDLFEP